MAREQPSIKEAVATVEPHIKLPDETTSKPVLILMTGLPGTGKSFVSRRIQQNLPSVIVQTDFVRKTLFPRPRYTAEESALVYRTSHAIINSLLRRGYRVIFDATNLVESKREFVCRIAERAGATVIIVRTVAPREVVFERFEQRKQGAEVEDLSDADAAIYERLRAEEQPIRRNHFTVDTSRDVEPIIQKILRLARR